MYENMEGNVSEAKECRWKSYCSYQEKYNLNKGQVSEKNRYNQNEAIKTRLLPFNPRVEFRK